MTHRRRIRLAQVAALACAVAGLAGTPFAGELPANAKSPAQLLAAADAANPEWREAAIRALASGWVLGRLYRLDDVGGKAFFAAFPKGADTPWAPGDAFDFGQVVEIELEKKGERRAVSGVRVQAGSPDGRDQGDSEQARMFADLQPAARAEGRSGVTLCRIRGWALSESSAGTAIRKGPSDEAPIVGRLARPYVSQDTDASSIDGWRAEFEITGYKDGWFRIDKATPPGSRHGDAPPKNHPQTYSDPGWVRVTDVTGAYANTQMPVARLLQYPNVDAQSFPPGDKVADPDGNLPIDGTLTRLHACSGNWALTTSRDGQRG